MTDRSDDIQKRLDGLDEIGQVVGALRAIAAGQIGAAHGAAEAAAAYAGTLVDAMAAVTADAPASTPGEGAGLLLVIGAAQGFSGSYPARIAEAAHSAMQQRPGLLVLGQRTLEILRGNGMPVLWSADLPVHPSVVPSLASRITDVLVSMSVDHSGPIRALVATAEGNSQPELRDLLPASGGSRSPRTGPPPLINLPVSALVAGLLQEAMFASVARALIDGIAAEAQARVEAMARAQENLRTRRTEVERQLQLARQEQITTEMIELAVSRS